MFESALMNFFYYLTTGITAMVLIIIMLRLYDVYLMRDSFKEKLDKWELLAALYYSVRFFGCCYLLANILG